ncbi:MAG TPA: hypothetical protein VGK25_08850 [Ignavibacteria bacterium]|jgi:hypothetical protein
MKKIIFPALLVLTSLSTHIVFSQSDFETYTPPKLTEGSNLLLITNPSFSAGRSTSFNGETADDKFYYNVNAGLDFRKWHFTPKLNYSVSSFMNAHFTKYSGLIVDLNRTKYAGDDANGNEVQLFVNLRGGSNYYFYKNLLYVGVYTELRYNVSNLYKPGFSLNVYPSIGAGQIFNAARVTQTLNIQQAMLDEKIIVRSLPEKTRKKLTEALDKRFEGEFTSKYKDDADIEFYALVEKILVDDGIISGGLNTRTVLKLFQALTNDKFVYFPNYKGYEFQAELKCLVNNRGTNYDTEEKTKLQSLTISGLYGRPVGIKNNITGSIFFTVPVQSDYIGDFFRYDFHSPITLIDYNNDYAVPNFDAAYYSDKLKYAVGSKLIFYHLLNKTAAISLSGEANYAKTVENWDRNSYNIRAGLIYNILSRLNGTINAGAYKSFYSVYNIYLSGSFFYYIF